MSGGYFEYLQNRLEWDIEEPLEELIHRQGRNKVPEGGWQEQYFKEHPEESVYPVESDNINKLYKDALDAVKKARVYVKAVDYYVSGDCGEEDTLLGLEKELKKEGLIK